MAISLLAANNAQSVLAAGISAAATTLTVNTGTGGLFPSPVPGTSFFKLTLIDADTGTLTEIVHVTQRVGDQMTIERGQEGSVARIWSANDLVANMMTAGTLSYLKQEIDGKLAKTGTAAAATKLATARTINGVAFDGSADITITAAANGGTAATTTGNAGTATKLATARTIGGVSFDGSANINLPGVNAAGNQPTTGNAATATKLATARKIGGVSFDGTANISIPAGNVGAYTKAEVDSRIAARGAKNKASKAAKGWWECGDTGVVFQWGTVGVGDNLPVTFPITFPSACISVQLSKNNSDYAGTSTANISATEKSRTGFIAHIYHDEVGADWLAVGY